MRTALALATALTLTGCAAGTASTPEEAADVVAPEAASEAEPGQEASLLDYESQFTGTDDLGYSYALDFGLHVTSVGSDISQQAPGWTTMGLYGSTKSYMEGTDAGRTAPLDRYDLRLYLVYPAHSWVCDPDGDKGTWSEQWGTSKGPVCIIGVDGGELPSFRVRESEFEQRKAEVLDPLWIVAAGPSDLIATGNADCDLGWGRIYDSQPAGIGCPDTQI